VSVISRAVSFSFNCAIELQISLSGLTFYGGLTQTGTEFYMQAM